MRRIARKIKSMFVPTPTREFSWSVRDFEAAKRWAKTQTDPNNPKQSLWAAVAGSGWDESAYILAKINEHVRPLLNE